MVKIYQTSHNKISPVFFTFTYQYIIMAAINIQSVLKKLSLTSVNKGVSTGNHWLPDSKKYIISHSPVDGKMIGKVSVASAKDYNIVIDSAEKSFAEWRTVPAPKRGEVVRQIGEELRKYKEPLRRLYIR